MTERRVLFLVALALTAWMAACSGPSPSGTSSSTTTGSGGGGGPSCPNDLPASCPAEVPSYTGDVAPLIEARCAPCHFAGGTESKKRLDSYASVYALRGQVLNQVYACKMPPAGETQLDAAERELLFSWLVCGAPDN